MRTIPLKGAAFLPERVPAGGQLDIYLSAAKENGIYFNTTLSRHTLWGTNEYLFPLPGTGRASPYGDEINRERV
jgi:hypothetical protein